MNRADCMAMARSIVEADDATACPILADALEDSGFLNDWPHRADVLTQLRTGTVVRAMFVARMVAMGIYHREWR